MSDLQRGDVVLCVLGTSGTTLDSLRAHTPGTVPILETHSQADAFARAAPADVVLLEPGTRIAPGWLEGLRNAAYASSTTASASALTQHDLDWTPGELDQTAATVRSGSLRLRPGIETPGDACVFVRRSAIDLVGDRSDGFWSECVARGLAHVLADDVLVLDPGPTSPRSHRASPRETRATSAVRRALHGLSITIDARILAGPTIGTHVHVLELIAGLARAEHVRLTAIVPDQPSGHALARLNGLPDVKLVTYGEATAGADIVHRPFQVSNAGDLTFLQTLGDRLILTQQDLIAFHNPAYFPSRDAWHEYRELTRTALAAADRVLFFSTLALDDALSEDLVDEAHADVVHLGVDHPRAAAQTETPPAGADALEARPFLLCLGTDFQHKNRIFALRLLAELNRRGVDVTLAFAGPTVAFGSSRPHEDSFLASHPELAGHIKDFGTVSEVEKQWLYNHSALVVYPSVLEGFGLVPFEAAAHRVPCMWAPGGSLSELLPDRAAGIVPWDARQSAVHALALIRDESAREQNLNAIDAGAAGLTWDATAAGLLDAYRATADAPARTGGAGIALNEDAARLVGPGGELPVDVQRPLLALAAHPKFARPVWGALKLGYRASHSWLQRRR